jgi:hypothetical protein
MAADHLKTGPKKCLKNDHSNIGRFGIRRVTVLVNKRRIKRLPFFQKRLQKELMKMVKEPPEGIVIDKETLEGNDLST